MIAEFIALKIDGLPNVKQRMLLSSVVLKSNTELLQINWILRVLVLSSSQYNKSTEREDLSDSEKF